MSSAVCTLLVRDISVVNTAFLLSLAVNYVIDLLGHRRGCRTTLTHEPAGSVFISLVASLTLWTTALRYYRLDIVLVTAVITSATHILTDAFTGYVYVRGLRSVRRVSLSLRRYDDYVLNTLSIGLALVITLLTLVAIVG